MVRNIKIIVGVFALAIVISYFLIDFNEDQFDQTTWTNYPTERYKMSKDIIESKMLIGKTENEVISFLGEAETSNLQGKAHLIFSLGNPPSFFEDEKAKLVVIFEDNFATKVIHSHE